jgi:hypothetical protein
MSIKIRYWKNKHGKYKAIRLYAVWNSLRGRCECSTDKSYKYYGGRGISVCAEWQDFDIFRAWSLNNGYRKGLTIDRRNNNGNYEPSNCQWVTWAVQNANKRVIERAPFGSSHCRAKLYESDVIVIRELLSVGLSRRHAAEFFDVSVSAIQHIDENRTWRHI